jgi:ribosomal protein S13
MAAPKKVDYERIEAGWRAGIKSPAQLAAEYTQQTKVSVSHAAIIKHFKKLGVPRDLGAKVHAKADAMVMESMVTGKVSTVTIKRDAEIIDDSAIIVANIRLAHRSDIARARSLAMALLGEMEAQTSNLDLFEKLSELIREGDEKNHDKRSDMFHKVISSVGRIDGMKKLAETLKTLITLEREAYGISAPQEINLNANIKSERKSQEMTDDELLAIAAGSSAGGADPA